MLVVNGDEHFIELKPMRNSRGQPIPNVLKLMVYGENDVHAVRVIVDPDSPGVFGFVPLIVPENVRARVHRRFSSRLRAVVAFDDDDVGQRVRLAHRDVGFWYSGEL